MALIRRKQKNEVARDNRALIVEPLFGPDGELDFDEEETEYIRQQWEGFASRLEDHVAPAKVADQIEKGMVANYLLEVARARLNRGDHENAALTCFRAVGIASWHPLAWLMLAEVYARFGDRAKAAQWLRKAQDVARSTGTADSYWKQKASVVRGLL